MTAAHTHLPVLGVPVESQALKGMDSLLSIVQMPAGRAGRARWRSAAPARSTRRSSPRRSSRWATTGVRERLRAFRATQTQTVLDNPDPAG